MGSNSVIAVLGFIVIASIVMGVINKRNNQSYDNAYSYVKYTTARDISRNAIQVALRKIDTISVVKSSDFPVTGSLDGGTYRIDGTILSDTTLRLTSRSRFIDTAYTIVATLYRKKIPLPPALFQGAFGIYSDSVNFTYNPNKDTIDGHDHDLMGNLIPGSPDSVSPVEVRTVLDSANVRAGVGSNLNTLIGTPKIWVNPAITNPNTSSDQFKQIADLIYTSPVGNTVNIGNGNDVLGDSTHPIVVFLDGTNKTTGLTNGQFSLKIKDGWGILVTKGNLKFTGGATWHGAVIVYGNVPLTLSASAGNSQVYGGVLFGGANNGTFSLAGNTRFLHSKAALTLRDRMKDPYIYEIVDWYE